MTYPSTDPATTEETRGEPRLGCVAIPIVASDIHQNLPNLFRLWVDKRFLPVLRQETDRPHLMIVVNRASEEQLEHIEALFRAHPQLVTCFSGFSTYSAELEGDRDLYVRKDTRQAGVFGRKAGPNFLFQSVMELAAPHGGFTLQVELDCLPIEAGWIDATQAVLAGHARAWVIGSVYAGKGMLRADNKLHLNGNALYRTGDRAFQAFFRNIWMPRLLHHIQHRPDLAYDCWWAVECFYADAFEDNESWRLFQTYDAFFQNDPYIVNFLVPPEGAQAYARAFDKFSLLNRKPVFFHGPALHAVCRELLLHSEDSIFDAIDRLDPPNIPRPPRQPMQTATLGEYPGNGAARVQPAAIQTDNRAAAQILLRATADLLGSDRKAAQSWLDPSSPRGQSLKAAQTALGKTHPSCAHFDRVQTYINLSRPEPEHAESRAEHS